MTSRFTRFGAIEVEAPQTWAGLRILSFDVDWASDEVLSYTLDLLEPFDIPATFFVTHDTPLLERMRANSKIELGIHPNFNPLIDGQSSSRSAEKILEDILSIVPEAKVLRCHSLTTSGKWLGMYQSYGITVASNYCMLGVEDLRPFYQVNGLIECPHYFADDGLVYRWDQPVSPPRTLEVLGRNHHPASLRVYNFHPIHLALNSESLARYEASRHCHRDWEALQPYRYDGFGVASVFEGLLHTAKPLQGAM